jgi:hypothetical protein
MNQHLKYVPVFRCRQQEAIVLKTFDFRPGIYPCVEIIKEFFVNPRETDPNKKTTNKRKPTKTFETEYLPIIGSIKAEKVFIDMPVHIKMGKKTPDETIDFLSRLSAGHQVKSKYFKKLLPFAPRIIPVISSYADISRERGTIDSQEKELRPDFNNLAFRCFSLTALRDLIEIQKVIQKDDYIFMDWEEEDLDLTDLSQLEIIKELKKMPCTIIVHRNSFPLDLANARLQHGEMIRTIDNSLFDNFKEFGGNCFSDFVGIKKDLAEGGKISPGFIYHDAVENSFYGFRYKNGGHKKDEIPPDLVEFETTIIPAVISCEASNRMHQDPLDYLGANNNGWKTIKNIELGEGKGGESGKNAAKFKKISMEHYLHCIKIKILSGYFD